MSAFLTSFIRLLPHTVIMSITHTGPSALP